MSTPQRPVRLLTELARPVILTRYRRDSCIASTAIGIKVLRRFGIDAWPVPVALGVFNERYLAMLEHFDSLDREPTKEEQLAWGRQGAWTVEVDDRDPRNNANPFIGHIVVGVEGALVDLSLDQASRPVKNIHLGPMWVQAPEGFYVQEREEDGTPAHVVHKAALVVYRHRPHLESFKQSRDWTQDDRHDDLVREIDTKIRKRLRRPR